MSGRGILRLSAPPESTVDAPTSIRLRYLFHATTVLEPLSTSGLRHLLQAPVHQDASPTSAKPQRRPMAECGNIRRPSPGEPGDDVGAGGHVEALRDHGVLLGRPARPRDPPQTVRAGRAALEDLVQVLLAGLPASAASTLQSRRPRGGGAEGPNGSWLERAMTVSGGTSSGRVNISRMLVTPGRHEREESLVRRPLADLVEALRVHVPETREHGQPFPPT